MSSRSFNWVAACVCIVVFQFQNNVAGQDHGFRIVGLVPVRNEEHRLPFCLRALSLFTDAIIVLDDASDDNTVAVIKSLAKECQIERILTKDGKWERDETADRNRMLAEGRAIGGTHFIVLDADEAFTGNLADGDELRAQILNLQIGQSIALHWIQLWKSGRYWRTDRLYDDNGHIHGLLGSMAMACAYRDDGVSNYEGEFIHTRRMPEALANHSILVTDLEVGLMHFQFVNWRNFILKQAWYKCFEKVRLPDKDDYEIYVRYSGSLDTIGQRATTVNPAWFARYEAFYLEEDMLHMDTWRIPMMQAWFDQYGPRHFEATGVLDMLRPYPDMIPGTPQPNQAAREVLLPSDRQHALSLIILPAAMQSTQCAINSLVSGLERIDPAWVQVIVSVCSTEGVPLDASPGVFVVKVDCGNAGRALNTAISASTGSVVVLVEGCVRLQVEWVTAVLEWYAAGTQPGTSVHASTLRPNLLSFPEEGHLSSSDDALCIDVAHHDADASLQPYLPLFPQDAGASFKPHWRFSGAVVAIPWSVLQATNGFQSDPAIPFHDQVAHFKDRAAIYKHEVWLAPRDLAIKRVFGEAACSIAEIPDEAVQQDGPGFPSPQDSSIALLYDLRDRRRSALAKDGIVPLA